MGLASTQSELSMPNVLAAIGGILVSAMTMACNQNQDATEIFHQKIKIREVC
jgi:hypothetical protein